MDRKLHLETIKKVKKFIYEKDYEGLKKYIEEREKQIATIDDDNKSSDYMEDLVNQLK